MRCRLRKSWARSGSGKLFKNSALSLLARSSSKGSISCCNSSCFGVANAAIPTAAICLQLQTSHPLSPFSRTPPRRRRFQFLLHVIEVLSQLRELFSELHHRIGGVTRACLKKRLDFLNSKDVSIHGNTDDQYTLSPTQKTWLKFIRIEHRQNTSSVSS